MLSTWISCPGGLQGQNIHWGVFLFFLLLLCILSFAEIPKALGIGAVKKSKPTNQSVSGGQFEVSTSARVLLRKKCAAPALETDNVETSPQQGSQRRILLQACHISRELPLSAAIHVDVLWVNTKYAPSSCYDIRPAPEPTGRLHVSLVALGQPHD